VSESHEALRVRIEVALRERWPDARVSVRPPMEDRYGGHDAMAVATWGNVEVLASGEDEQTALGEVADAVCLELREHADHPDALLARQHAILTGVADALRGDPGPLASHSHHDLAERAAAMEAEIATLRAVRLEPMTLTALDAACAAEDRATADEPLLDGTDGAHPAWWRGHDRAAEMLTAQRDAALADAARARDAYATDLAGLRAEVRRADEERAEWRDLRDAVRAYLTALDEPESDGVTARVERAMVVLSALAGAPTGGDATMRRDLPAEAVVSCPACGYGVTADLDDDGAYVTRRHSRRERARVGLGDIVWCDGGIARTVSR